LIALQIGSVIRLCCGSAFGSITILLNQGMTMLPMINTTTSNVLRTTMGRFALLVTASMLIAAPAHASTQGTLGATSQGSVQISVSVPSRVQISNLTDVDLTNSELGSVASRPQSPCVWTNTATKSYTITASGSGTGNAFTLAAGQLAPISYAVQWAGTTGQTTGTALTPAAASSSFVSTALLPGCTVAGSSASLIVTVAPGQLETMASATPYTGTLTLLVNPI
jgi:hypothetical protein